MKLYPPQNPADLEPHYCRHVEAMTAEGLDEKSDIAAQLAARDARIAELEGLLRTANHWRERHSRDAEAYGKQSNENWERARDLEAKLAIIKTAATDLRATVPDVPTEGWSELDKRLLRFTGHVFAAIAESRASVSLDSGELGTRCVEDGDERGRVG